MSALRRLELLAPARTAAIGREAVRHGADAVYIGGPSFGARHNAGNGIADIAALVQYAHRFRVRVYVALNTILRDDELEPARQLAWQCWDAGVDALIVQDMGLLEIDMPPLALHASTQCDIRTPEKASFLAAVGFSQIVLARELSLAEVAAVRAAVPAEVCLEYFVHGALCVAYSGQCYLSHAHTGRSANRGDCSQACRLPYTLTDGDGRVVAHQQHLLSLKDNDQSGDLAALIDAGVDSFKIEGRYKEADYVKNVTGHYRRRLDAILEQRPDLAPASSGRTHLAFTPAPEKTFHRGASDYFAHGRQADIGAFATPAFVGTPLGAVTRIGADSFDIDCPLPLANGDGLAWLHKGEAQGTRANRVECLGPGRWRVWPGTAAAALAGLRLGTEVSRNRDQAWEQLLQGESAQRRIALCAHFTELADGYELTLTDSDGCSGSAGIVHAHAAAHAAATAEDKLRQQLARLGGSDFVLATLTVTWREPRFLPASVLNQLRRTALARLEEARLAAWQRPPRRAPTPEPAPYPQQALSYLANVYNAAARAFYARHGVRLIAAAYEAHEERGAVPLMITRHCLRYSFSLCPKQAKGVTGVQGTVTAAPMTLVNGKERLTLAFDCQACEMHVIGRIKPQLLLPEKR